MILQAALHIKGFSISTLYIFQKTIYTFSAGEYVTRTVRASSKCAQLQVSATDVSYTSGHELQGPPVSSVCTPILALIDCDRILLNLLFDMNT